MVNRCSSNPGTNIGKPVFMNDPDILFMLMFKSLFLAVPRQLNRCLSVPPYKTLLKNTAMGYFKKLVTLDTSKCFQL